MLVLNTRLVLPQSLDGGDTLRMGELPRRHRIIGHERYHNSTGRDRDQPHDQEQYLPGLERLPSVELEPITQQRSDDTRNADANIPRANGRRVSKCLGAVDRE